LGDGVMNLLEIEKYPGNTIGVAGSAEKKR
jgi:hypothetical protein